MNKSQAALVLIDQGVAQADAARAVGVSRQAVAAALKAREAKQVERKCSECGAALPDSARAGAMTCSGACRVKRARRLKAQAVKDTKARIAAERVAIGLPAKKA